MARKISIYVCSDYKKRYQKYFETSKITLIDPEPVKIKEKASKGLEFLINLGQSVSQWLGSYQRRDKQEKEIKSLTI